MPQLKNGKEGSPKVKPSNADASCHNPEKMASRLRIFFDILVGHIATEDASMSAINGAFAGFSAQ